MPELEIFKNFIRSRGLRQTPERENIVVEIFRKREHFDVEELFLRLLAQGRKISKASIYRTLPLLVDCGLIREVNFVDGHWHYEQIYGQPHHCHLRCLGCGAMVEFEEPLMSTGGRKIIQFLWVQNRQTCLGSSRLLPEMSRISERRNQGTKPCPTLSQHVRYLKQCNHWQPLPRGKVRSSPVFWEVASYRSAW